MNMTTRFWMTSTMALSVLFAGNMVAVAAPQPPSATTQPAAKEKLAKKEKHKSQAETASKSATFASVSATDKSVTGALKSTDLEGAKKLEGKAGAFTGTVTKVFAPKGNSLVILNFAADYKTAVTAVVRWKSFSAFPTLTSLEGKKVLVSGKFVNYQDRPEIELTSPSQLKIVK
jgi:hypothetical protein